MGAVPFATGRARLDRTVFSLYLVGALNCPPHGQSLTSLGDIMDAENLHAPVPAGNRRGD